MRILHVINSLNPGEGGTVECVRLIGTAVAAEGHSVEVASCKDTPDAPWVASFPLQVHALGPGIGRYSFSLRLRSWLRSNGSRYDAWIINGLWQYQGYCASRTARSLGIPYLIYAHGMLGPWARTASRLKYFKKWLYWNAVERQTLNCADAVLFTSSEEASLAPGFFGESNWTTCVVGNGVPNSPALDASEVSAFMAKHRLAKSVRYFLFLGRIHPIKGLEDLIGAMGTLPDGVDAPVLIIAGEGERNYVDSLKARAAAKMGNNIIWTGPLRGKEKWAAFSIAELCILPSHHENFGLVIAEALSAAVPVCITRSVNIWRDIERSGAGLICDDNQVSLGTGLKDWLRFSSQERAKFAARARQCHEMKFRVDDVASRLIHRLQESIAKTKRGTP